MTVDFYPREAGGEVAGNYLLADDAARPSFGPAQYARAEAKDAPPIVIIGAGFTGIAAALQLAELRADARLPVRIVLLEANRVASGPSGKSAGHVCGLQAPDEAIRRHCGPELARRLLAAAADAVQLVRHFIARFAIPCDLRDGYLEIGADGRQTVAESAEFGIDPYPFALGLARAAAELGVEIREGVQVSDLTCAGGSCVALTSAGPIRAALALACGGDRMAGDIPLLAALRSRTTEVRVGTIITDPLPDAVLRRAMPPAAGRRFPFANNKPDVAYGSVDRSNRIVFGACAAALREPRPERIARVLAAMLPELLPAYRQATGKDLGWRPLVVDERLCFTRDWLPNVGAVQGCRSVLYVHALGGHGIALGTLLGTAAAEKLWSMHLSRASSHEIFDAFAAVPHAWLPPRQPWRSLAAALGLSLGKIQGRWT